jgi:polysaccharide biosynthesis protein PslH
LPRRVLFLTPESPFPVLGGGAQRIASLMEYATHHGASVDLLTFAPCTPPPDAVNRCWHIPLPANGRSLPARVLRNAGRFVRGVPPLIDRLSGFESQIAAALEGQRYDVIFVEHFWLGPYVDLLHRFGEAVICDLHNVESEFFHSLSRAEAWPSNLAHRRFAGLSEQLERRYLPRYTRALVTSERDAERVAELAPGLPVTVFPNTIPWRPLPEVGRERVVVFSGNLEYHPNQQAVAWFGRDLWPRLQQEEAGLRWRLVGMNPEAVRGTVAGLDRVELTGAVEDALAEIARGTVAVVPLLAGSGTRVKILEAWAAGTPVVSTRIGAEGLPGLNGEHYLLADTATEFLAAICRVLQDERLATRLREAGRLLYEETFHRAAAWKHLDQSRILGDCAK